MQRFASQIHLTDMKTIVIFTGLFFITLCANAQTYDTTFIQLDQDEEPEMSFVFKYDSSDLSNVLDSVYFSEEVYFLFSSDRSLFFDLGDTLLSSFVSDSSHSILDTLVINDQSGRGFYYFGFRYLNKGMEFLGWIELASFNPTVCVPPYPGCIPFHTLNQKIDRYFISDSPSDSIIVGRDYQQHIAFCKADAGEDVAVCLGDSAFQIGSDTLGGSPTAAGGYPPYRYHWSESHLNYKVYNVLSDSLVSNPVFKSYGEGDIILTVVDSLGSKCQDTVHVYRSHFAILPTESTFYCEYRDDIQHGMYGVSMHPDAVCKWSDHTFIDPSDSLSCYPRLVLPSLDTFSIGHGTIVDPGGCTFSPNPICIFYSVVSSVAEIEQGSITLSPNPSSHYFRVSFEREVSGELVVLNSHGVEVLFNEFSQVKQLDQFHNLNPGVYQLNLQFDFDEVASFKLIVQ